MVNEPTVFEPLKFYCVYVLGMYVVKFDVCVIDVDFPCFGLCVSVIKGAIIRLVVCVFSLLLLVSWVDGVLW